MIETLASLLLAVFCVLTADYFAHRVFDMDDEEDELEPIPEIWNWPDP